LANIASFNKEDLQNEIEELEQEIKSKQEELAEYEAAYNKDDSQAVRNIKKEKEKVLRGTRELKKLTQNKATEIKELCGKW